MAILPTAKTERASFKILFTVIYDLLLVITALSEVWIWVKISLISYIYILALCLILILRLQIEPLILTLTLIWISILTVLISFYSLSRRLTLTEILVLK